MKTIILMLLMSLTALAEQQISLFGVTIHGGATDPDMTNKLDDSGRAVFNPQINYMNINEDGRVLLHAAFLKDCYGHGAGFIAYGKRYKVDERLYLGLEIGVYARQVPRDDNDDLHRMMRYGLYQVLPSPALIMQYKIAERIVIRAQSNFLINFFDVAWAF